MSDAVSESDLYAPIRMWLKELLRGHNPRSQVEVLDTSQRSLSRILEDKGWTELFEGWETFDVHVDITGFVFKKRSCNIHLIEVKLNPVTLRDVGQLLGYCRVVRPHLGLILSPRGLSKAMSSLLELYQRLDVLDYGPTRPMVVARWLETKRDIEYATLIPQGVALP
ncbi:MAG: hypothetical protein HY304_06530 [candidate division Zixibacteria bacterium]|nr:hypothetical protein [candidate division Zixibacteria bacterium]